MREKRNTLTDKQKAGKASPRKSRQLRRLPLTSLGGVIQEMAQVYRKAKSGKMLDETARSRVWILDKMRSGLEALALERLEAKMDAVAKTAGNIGHGHTQADYEHRLPH